MSDDITTKQVRDEQPQDSEIQRARDFLHDVGKNIGSYDRQQLPGDRSDLAAIATLEAVLDEREQLAARVAETEPRPGHGPGVPGAMHLEAFGEAIRDAFGDIPYHVGSSATSKTWRDVDVRLILDDDKFHALFPGFTAANHIDAWWSLLCAALSELGRVRTGLPIDFQIQSMTDANEKYPTGIRSPLFLIRAEDDHRPTMQPAARLAALEAAAPATCECGCPKVGDGCDCRFCDQPHPTQRDEAPAEGSAR